MSTNPTCPLPDGLVDELLDQLPDYIRCHLLQTLCNPNTAQSDETSHPNDPIDSCSQAQTEQVNDNDGSAQPPTEELQSFILSNITRIGHQFLCQDGHDFDLSILLCQLVTSGHFCNVIELDLHHNPEQKWINDDCDDGSPLLAKINPLLPLILTALPQLKSFTLPRIGCNPCPSPFFSLPRLFPIVGQSSQLETLSLAYTGLKTDDVRYFAFHSNYMFPALTSLDVSGMNFFDPQQSHAGINKDHFALYYLFQWIERCMPKLVHLSLGCCSLTTPDITKYLANSPILARLESLDLSINPKVDAEGWQALFTSQQFTNSSDQDRSRLQINNSPLKTLQLRSNNEIKSLIPLLTQNCPYLTNLTTLDLNTCCLDDSSIQSICESKWIRGLECLSLQRNTELTSESIRMIADCEGMRNLTSLDLGRRRVGQFPVELLGSIAHSQYVSKLTNIMIDFGGIEYDESVDQALLDCFHSPNISSLTHLTLDCTRIDKSIISSILSSPMLSNLEEVTFRGFDPNESNYYEDSFFLWDFDWDHKEDEVGSGLINEWIDAFVSSPHCSRLRKLTLAACHLTDSNVLAISQSPYLSNLRYLDLSRNPALTNDSIQYLARSEGMQLEELHLKKLPQLTSLIFHHLTQSNRFLSGLKTLCIKKCPLICKKDQKILFKAGWFDGKVDILSDNLSY